MPVHRLANAFAIAALAAAAAAQNPYTRPGANIGIVGDLKAHAVGDILTVTIQETHTVKRDDKVERTNNTTLAARLESYTLSDKTFKANVLPKVDVRKDSSFTGEAKQDAGSDVRASIAVIVVDVQPNGNLVVAGQRTVQVDDETKTLKVSGIVRSLDVTSQNTVNSSQVAEAKIAITGDGAGTRQVSKGPVGQLFDTLIWAAWPF